MIGFETFRRFVTRIDYGTQDHHADRSEGLRSEGRRHRRFRSSSTATTSRSRAAMTAFRAIHHRHRRAQTADAEHAVRREERSARCLGQGRRSGRPAGASADRPRRSCHGGGAEDRCRRCRRTAGAARRPTRAAPMPTTTLAGNIGGGVLKRFVVTFDYEHNTMYLKPIAGRSPISTRSTAPACGSTRTREGFKVVDVTAEDARREARASPRTTSSPPSTASPPRASRCPTSASACATRSPARS